MSQIAMTEPERICALERLGYSGPGATFLALAALHGGYFLRRQYAQFLGRQDGGTVTQLVQKALACGHVKSSTWRQKTQLYHLCARPFYEALGQGDNRNRRQRQLATIKNKIMGLDFVLAHRQYQYLATEQEKVEYFTAVLKLDPAQVPAKLYYSAKSHATTARYFVEKYPVFLAPAPESAGSPVVSFCFVDEGMTSLSGLETFLAHYRCLLGSLPTFHLIYVAASDIHFTGAQRLFDHFARQGAGGKNGVAGDRLHRLLEYFEARQLFETKQFGSFDRAKLLRLRDLREEFSDKEKEALFEHWKAVGSDAVRRILMPKRPELGHISGTFSTHLLEHDYGLFDRVAAL